MKNSVKNNNPKIDQFGNKFWCNDEHKYHREDGPAIEWVNCGNRYFKNGKLHREDGPAVEMPNGRKEYWVNNKQYDSLEEGLMNEALE